MERMQHLEQAQGSRGHEPHGDARRLRQRPPFYYGHSDEEEDDAWTLHNYEDRPLQHIAPRNYNLKLPWGK